MLLIQIILILEKAFAITTFYSCDVTASGEINKKGDYVFSIVRSGDSVNHPINLQTNYYIQIDYPWVINSDYTCYNELNTLVTCSYSSQKAIIQNYFVQNYGSTDYDMSNGFSFTINLNSVLNPSYSGTYDNPIQVSIVSSSNEILEQCPNGGVYPSVNPGTATCYGDGLQSKVNTTSQSMSLSIIVATNLAIESYLVVQYTQYWENDKINKAIIPGSITCSIYGNNILISSTTCTLLADYKIKSTLGNGYNAQNITLVINGINSPSSTAPVGTFILKTYNPNSKLIDKCTTSSVANWLPNQVILSSMTWTQLVNQVEKLNLVFQLNSQIAIGDTITINLPKEIVVNSTILTSIKDTKSSFFTSSTSTFGLSGQQITITSLKSFTATLTNVQLTFYNVGSPPSVKPTSSVSVSTSRGSYLIDQSSTTLSISATQGTITSVSIVAVNTIINQYSDYNFAITLNNHLLSDGYIVIQFPTQFNLGKITTISNYQLNSVSYSATFGVFSQLLTISSLSTADIPSNSIITFTISQIQNQFSANISNTFGVYTYFSKSSQNYLVDQHTTYQMNTFTSGTIDTNTIKISTQLSKTGYPDSYTIQFVNTNQIITSGFILLTLSSTITITSGSQICYINSVTSTCSQSSTNVIKLIVPSTISSSQTINVQINNMLTNPYTLIPVTNAVTLSTYDDQSLLIDNGLGGTLTIQYLSEFTLKLSSRSSYINGVKSTYTFILNFEVNQQNGIYVILKFPSDLVFSLNSCSSSSPLSTTVPCTYSNQELLLQLICSTCTSIPKNQDILITVNYIVNYFSLMPISINSGYSIQDQSNLLSKQSQLKSSLTLTNNAANSIKSYSQNYQYGYLDTLDNYSFSFVLNNKFINYFKIVIGVPSDIVVYQSTDSTPTSLSNVVNLPNGYTVSVQGQNIIITGYTTIEIETFSFTINNLLNPKKTTSSSSFTINTYSVVSPSEYQMDCGNLNIYSHKCTLPCKDCDTILSQCSSCYDSSKSSLVNQQIYYFTTTQTSTCVTDCTSYTGYFVVIGQYTCQQCSSECKTCQNIKTYCLTCSGTLKFYNNTCLDTCPTGYFNNQLQCKPCINNCDTCSDNVSCEKCSSNYYLYQSICYATCPTGITITNTQLQTCDVCTNNCQTCQTTTSYCQTCVTNYYFYQNTCVSKCQEGTYLNNNQCQTCMTKCKACTDGSTCSSCNSPAIFHLNDCIGQCPDQFFQTTSYTCQQCSSSCFTCEVNQYKCTSCLSSSYLYNNSCSTICPDKYYPDQISNKCVSCVPPCETCKSSTQCQSCVSQTPTLYYYNNSCNTSCLSYYAPENGQCVACRQPCKQCTTSPDTCNQCYPNTYLLGTSCVTDCGTGNYQNNQQYTCSVCSLTCKTCETQETKCTSCNDGQYLFQSTCVNQCSDGYYAYNQQCQTCSTTCSTCVDGATCSKCKDSLILYNSQCLASCPANLFLVDNVCVGCKSPCLTCSTSPEACLTCTQNTYLNLNSECVASCGDGYYGDQVSNKCIICVSPCQTCSSTTVCLSCVVQVPQLYFYDNSCHTECKTNYVPVNGVCTACLSPCQSCSTTPNYCTYCAQSTYLTGSECVTSCDSGYYNDSTTRSCKPCIAPCLTCTSEAVCTSCITTNTKNIFYNNECISSCPTGYYKSNYTCLLCTETSTDSVCQSTVEVIQSIQTEKFIPLPFTILTFIFIISVIVAKIQRPETFIPGAICAFGGFFEWCSHGVLLYLSYLEWDLLNLQNYIIMGGLGINYLLNIVNLISGKIIYHKDPLFQQWLQSRGVNRITYAIVSFLGLVTTFKVNKVLVSRYFGFYFFKVRISNVHELLPFNIVSLLSILFNSIPLIVASTIIINIHDSKDQLYISSIDCVIVTFLIFIAQIWEAQKEEEFFHDPCFQSLNQSLAYRLDQSEQQPQQQQEEVIEQAQQVNIESTNNQKKNFLLKNKSATIFQQDNAIVPADLPFFPTQNNEQSSNSNSAQKRFAKYLKKDTKKNENSLDLSSILQQSQHLNEFSQEKDLLQDYQVLQFQNPEQPVGNLNLIESKQDLNFSSELELDDVNKQSATPQNATDNSQRFKKRNKTVEIITIDDQIPETQKPATIEVNQVEQLNLEQQDLEDIEQERLNKLEEERLENIKLQEEKLRLQEQERLKFEEQERLRLQDLERLKQQEIEEERRRLEQEKIIQEKIEQERLRIKEEEEIRLEKLRQEQQQKEDMYQENLRQLRENEEKIRLEHEAIKQQMIKQEQERQQALLERQKAEEERKRIEDEERQRREYIETQNKIKEEQILKQKEEQQRLWLLEIEAQKKKQNEQVLREQELRNELEREKEEKLKFQLQLQEKLQREEQERIEAEQKLIEQKKELERLEQIRLDQLEQLRLDQIRREEERVRKEQQEKEEQERMRQQQIKIAEELEQQRLKQLEEEKLRNELEKQQLLERQRQIEEELQRQQAERQEGSDGKNIQLIQFDFNENQQFDEIPMDENNHSKKENIFLQIDISDNEEQVRRGKQLGNESVQSAEEEIINFDEYDHDNREEDQNEQFRMNNPENIFAQKKSSHSITYQNSHLNPSKINKTIQDQPSANPKARTQYQFLPKKNNLKGSNSSQMQQLQQSRQIQRPPIKYPNSNNTPQNGQNRLQVGSQGSQYPSYNNFSQKPAVTKEKDDRYLRQKEEIYLQHIPNYYEKQIQEEMKKKKQQQQKKNYLKQSQQKQQYEEDDDANLDF